MTIRPRSACLIALSVVLALGACAQTKLSAVWRDPTYRGDRLRKIMVIGVAENPDRRRTFESQFVAAFKYRSIDAVSSITLMPGEEELSKETIRAAIAEYRHPTGRARRQVDPARWRLLRGALFLL
jgi:hypothetical protein